MWYPDGTFDDNSQDDFDFNPEDVEVSTQYGYTSAPMDLGYQSGEAAGNIINAIADAMIEGIKNEQATKANTYAPPALNNSLRNTPYYNFGTTFSADGKGNYNGSDGINCTHYSDTVIKCNNGVTYNISNAAKTRMVGSDGTTYVSDWKDESDNIYYCVTSSFGSKCCGDYYYKTCSSSNIIPDNAHATSSGWRCNNGYLKISDKCKKVNRPSN